MLPAIVLVHAALLVRFTLISGIRGNEVPYTLPELLPEFVLCWLVPLLAKLPLLRWFHGLDATPLSGPKKQLLKMIFQCFKTVLAAMTDITAFTPHLPADVLKSLPGQMLMFMKWEDDHERQVSRAGFQKTKHL